jgi:hypothetical protein
MKQDAAKPRVWDPLRKKYVALTPEERVRQWFITVLRDRMGVPVHQMNSEVAMTLGAVPFRADILVFARGGAPWMVVECKREDLPLSPEVLEQVLRYNLALDVPYIAITNGRQSLFFRRSGALFDRIDTPPCWSDGIPPIQPVQP